MWFIVFYADTYRVERVKNDKQVLYNIVYKYMYGGIKLERTNRLMSSFDIFTK